MSADESAPENEASLADEPEVRQALAEADRASVASVVAGHPSSPLAWAELADLADSEGHSIEAFAFAAVAVDLAREQLAASGWTPGSPVPWSDEPNRAYLRALDAQRRAALALGLDGQAGEDFRHALQPTSSGCFADDVAVAPESPESAQNRASREFTGPGTPRDKVECDRERISTRERGVTR